jgi:hypothetical protein
MMVSKSLNLIAVVIHHDLGLPSKALLSFQQNSTRPRRRSASGTLLLWTHWVVAAEGLDMTDEFTAPEEPAQSAVSQAVDGIKSASQRVSDTIETGLEPGMPLDILATHVREAPLAALAVAFMLGVLVGRRRR